jgi:hypothetical protein
MVVKQMAAHTANASMVRFIERFLLDLENAALFGLTSLTALRGDLAAMILGARRRTPAHKKCVPKNEAAFYLT